MSNVLLKTLLHSLKKPSFFVISLYLIFFVLNIIINFFLLIQSYLRFHSNIKNFFICNYFNKVLKLVFNTKLRELPSLVKGGKELDLKPIIGGGLRIHSHRSSGVQISLPALFRLLFIKFLTPNKLQQYT